jgi:hypothetical protein
MNENSLNSCLLMTEDTGLLSDSAGMRMCRSINLLHMPFNTVMLLSYHSLGWEG